MRRESNERMADFAVADVSLFWLLNALNSAEPVLGQFQRNLQSPPERLYPELSRLAGSLLTFSTEHQVSAIPAGITSNSMRYFHRCLICLAICLKPACRHAWWPRHSTMTHGCTSGRLACMTRVCAKGLITIFLCAHRFRWRNCRSSFRASVRWAALTMCGDRQLFPRGRAADAAAPCASRHSTAHGKSVFQSRSLPSSGD